MRICCFLIFYFCSIGVCCAENYTADIVNNLNSVTVTYRFTIPVKSVKFKKLIARSGWVTGKGFAHVKSSGYDTFQKKNREVFSQLEIKVPVVYQDSHGYPQFFLFKDGGREVYSDYFIPDLMIGNDGKKLKADGYLNFYNANKGEDIIIDREHYGKHIINIKLEKGLYIYFGKNKLQHVGNVDYIVDSGIPLLVQNRLKKLVSSIISHYENILNQHLDKNILVFFILHPDKGFLDLTGEVSNYQVNLKMTGKFNEDNPFNSKFLHLVAHELFHLWNAEMFKHTGPSWIHEGSAEYFSTYILRKLNLIDESTYNDIIVNSLNTCASQVGQYSLSDSDIYGVDNMIYGCGAVVNYSIDKYCGFGCSTRLWKTLFSGNSPKKTYNQEAWFNALKETVHNDQFYNKMYDFILKPVKTAYISNVYRDFGWDLAKKQLPEDKKFLFVSDKMFYQLMISDCGGSFSYAMKSDMSFQLKDTSSCKTFKYGKITKLDRQRVGSYALYKEIKHKCDAGDSISVMTEKGKSYPFVCHAKLPELPPFFEMK